MTNPKRVKIVGGGLAGCEAAWFLAERGIGVDLYEMRPNTMTPAHSGPNLAEVVCSNSFKGEDPATAHGMLKQELRAMGSLLLQIADETRVPAGKALAVDRDKFSELATEKISQHPAIQLIRTEVDRIDPDEATIIASGPLTSPKLTDEILRLTDSSGLAFYDAIAPIIEAQSIDMHKAFFGSRWEDDNNDYLNCPMEKDEYESFIDALLEADRVNPRSFEDASYFEGCLPVEVIAGRGRESLRYGGMRPIGFTNPHTGRRPYAIVQLRRENLAGEAYNLVGFQTRLTYPGQDKVFRLIPGLENATFLRHGSIHRNTFINSPQLLSTDLSLRNYPRIRMAGQLIGVEGYIESAASGLLAGISQYCALNKLEYRVPPRECALGSLINHITDPAIEKFQPMNINFGIMPMPDVRKKERKEARLKIAAESFAVWIKSIKQITNG